MSDSGSQTNNLLKAWANWHAPQSIPLLQPAQAHQVPGVSAGPLPAEGLFNAMTPAQQFWFQHLMGQDVGQLAPGGSQDPYYMMMMMSGPQGAVQASGAEEEPGF